MNDTLTNTQILSTTGKLSTDEETEGYNLEVGESWIYPTNFPIREYQYDIINQAIYQNTMVCLPTGLGKTFIAAVIMYNFFRWYPQGKIIFLAPTRPLVKQQIDACYNVMAIPKNVTAELTGTNLQTSRATIWNEKRVFFVTPQVLQNDIDNVPDLGKNIKCLVFDEAHKARGNHAYCEVIKKIYNVNKYFRVLALSATPGNSISDVVKVCQGLLIAHLEIRTEECKDVKPYVFKRTIETILVPFGGKLSQVRSDYIRVLDKYVRTLINYRVIQGNCATLTKGRMFMVMKEFQEKNKHNKSGSYNEIVKTLNICIILYHGFEVLERHGMRGFLKFSEDNRDKPLLRNNEDLENIMDDVRVYLGPTPNVQMLPDGSIDDIPEDTKFGHPKYYKLSEILMKHFNSTEGSTRVIVFCEFKESVMEAYAILLKHKSIIKPRVFMGQGAITQKQQITIIKAFKTGECNTLISTCIGEEGLDVGEVDLIVCFDISNKSPIRMIQRMGRTGRKREGKVIMLVTEGKEHQILQECLTYKNSLTNSILKSKELLKELYNNNPKMIPDHINLTCHKMHITVTKPVEPAKDNNIKSMFKNISKKNEIFTDYAIIDFEDRIPVRESYFDQIDPLLKECNENRINFSSKLENQKILHSNFGDISSSAASNLLVSLLEFADCKRYNIPLVQIKTNPKSGKTTTANNGFKQSDIRSMFQKQSILQSQKEIISQGPIVMLDQIDSENNDLNELNIEVSNYLSINQIDASSCKICDNLFICDYYETQSDEFVASNWVHPDITVLNMLNIENLNTLLEITNNKTAIDAFDDNMFDEFDDLDDIMANIDIKSNKTHLNQSNLNTSCNSSKIRISEIAKTINNSPENENKGNGNCDLIHIRDESQNVSKIDLKLNDNTRNCFNDFDLNDDFNKDPPIDISKESVELEKHNSNNELSVTTVKIPIIVEDKYKHVIENPNFSLKDLYYTFELPKSAKKVLHLHNDENTKTKTQKLNTKPFNSIENVHENFKHCLDFFQVSSLNDFFESTNDQINISQDLDATIILSQSVLQDYTVQILNPETSSTQKVDTSKLVMDTKKPSTSPTNSSIKLTSSKFSSPKSQPSEVRFHDLETPIRGGLLVLKNKIGSEFYDTTPKSSTSQKHEISPKVLSLSKNCHTTSKIVDSCNKIEPESSSHRSKTPIHVSPPSNLDTPIRNDKSESSRSESVSPILGTYRKKELKNDSIKTDVPAYETDEGSPILCSYRDKQLKRGQSKRLFNESSTSIYESFNDDDLKASTEKIAVKKIIKPKPNLSTLKKRRDGFYIESTSLDKSKKDSTRAVVPKKLFSENIDKCGAIKNQVNQSPDLFDSNYPISRTIKDLNIEDFCDESFLDIFEEKVLPTENAFKDKSISSNAVIKSSKKNIDEENLNVSIDALFNDDSFGMCSNKSKYKTKELEIEDFFDADCFGILPGSNINNKRKLSDEENHVKISTKRSKPNLKSRSSDDYESDYFVTSPKKSKNVFTIAESDNLFGVSGEKSKVVPKTNLVLEDFFDDDCFGLLQTKTKDSPRKIKNKKSSFDNEETIRKKNKTTSLVTDDFETLQTKRKDSPRKIKNKESSFDNEEMIRTKNKTTNLVTDDFQTLQTKRKDSPRKIKIKESSFDNEEMIRTKNKTTNLVAEDIGFLERKTKDIPRKIKNKESSFDNEEMIRTKNKTTNLGAEDFGLLQRKTKASPRNIKNKESSLDNQETIRTKSKTTNLGAEDFCDMDIFGLLPKEVKTKTIGAPNKLTIDDICDLSIFDIFSKPAPSKKHKIDEDANNVKLDDVELTVTQILKLNESQVKINNTQTNHNLLIKDDYKINTQETRMKNTQPIITTTQKTILKNKPSESINVSQKSNKVLNKYPSLQISTSQKTKPDLSQISKQVLIPKEKNKITDQVMGVDNYAIQKPPNISQFLKSFTKSTPKRIGEIMTNSDDEFEVSPIKPKWINCNNKTKKVDDSPVFRRTKKSALRINDTAATSINKEESGKMTYMSDDDFEADAFSDENKFSPIRVKKKNKKPSQFGFIDLEADVSSDASTDSEYEGGASQDKLEESFVHDEIDDFESTTDMHAIYLQSVMSPLKNKGAFKLPQLPTKINADIFSQDVVCEDSYVNDSFCVNTEDITVQRDLSELEIAENILKERRKRKKKINIETKPKRRRIVHLSDESD